jgi:D-alanine-D-alanine ligase
MKNIALLYGGDSREAVISRQSAANVYGWIDKQCYNVFMIEVRGAQWRWMQDGQALADVDKNDFSIDGGGEKVKFDLAFIMIHGTPGENGLLQSYLEMLGIPHTTCSAFVSALTFNKFACKAFLQQALGIPTAKDILITKRKGIETEIGNIVTKLNLPLFVKPNGDGSSFGVSKVKTEAEVMPAIDRVFESSDEVIIEEFIAGTEVTAGVMRLHGNIIALPVTEIVSTKDFFDYEAKYTKGLSQEITPARLDANLYQKVQASALQIYRTLRCDGIVRIDYIIRDNTPYFLEINTIPGMSSNSIIPQQLRYAAYTPEQTMTDLIETTLSKN